MSDHGGVSKITRWLKGICERLDIDPAEALSVMRAVLLVSALIGITHIGFATHYPRDLNLILDPAFFYFTVGRLALWVLLTSAIFKLISSTLDYVTTLRGVDRGQLLTLGFSVKLAVKSVLTAFISFRLILSLDWVNSLFYISFFATFAMTGWKTMEAAFLSGKAANMKRSTQTVLTGIAATTAIAAYVFGDTLAQNRSAAPPQNTLLDGKRYSLVAIGPTSMGHLYFSPTEDLYLTWQGGSTLRTIGTTSTPENSPKPD